MQKPTRSHHPSIQLAYCSSQGCRSLGSEQAIQANRYDELEAKQWAGGEKSGATRRFQRRRMPNAIVRPLLASRAQHKPAQGTESDRVYLLMASNLSSPLVCRVAIILRAFRRRPDSLGRIALAQSAATCSVGDPASALSGLPRSCQLLACMHTILDSRF